MSESSQAEILAKLRRQAAGSYDRVKGCDAVAGGRSLPGNIKNGVAQATMLKLGESEKNGMPYVYLYATGVEAKPHDVNGIFAGIMFGLWEDDYNTFDDNFQTLLASLKLIKPQYKEWIEAADESQFFTDVFPRIKKDIDEENPFYLINTSNRASKDGSFKTFVAGHVQPGYQAPPDYKKRNKHDMAGYQQVNAPPRNPPGASPPGPSPTPPGPKLPPVSGGPPLPSACPVKVGQKAKTIDNAFGDGNVYNGVIASIDEVTKIVLLQIGGNNYPVPFAKIAPDDQPSAPPAPVIAVGSRVMVRQNYFGDGESYGGEVESLNGTLAKVKFANGAIDIETKELSLA